MSSAANPTADVRYGPWTIHYDPPPIPDRRFDWHFVHDDFDASWEGEEDGYVSNGLSGSAESVEACKREIHWIEDDKGMPFTASAEVRAMFEASIAAVHPTVVPGFTLAGDALAAGLAGADA